jgi:thiol-disulfide isomerase/thioredoxin
MAATPSTMLPLGTLAPNFHLLDVVSGEIKSLEQLKSPIGTIVMFICNHCPYVKHILPVLVTLVNEYQKKGIITIAINSNDVENYPEDSPEKMKQLAIELGNPFVYLYDENQSVAKAYQAACTPDFYVFDGNLKCVYRGRFDNSTPKNEQPVTGLDLKKALDYLLLNKSIVEEQLPSIGCNIKWKES